MQSQIPASIFKYYDLKDENSLNIISNQEVYFQTPRKWEIHGEFEHEIKFVNELEDKKQLRGFVNSLRNKDENKLKKIVSKKLVINRPFSFTSWIMEAYIQTLYSEKDNWKSLLKNFGFDRVGIFCTTPNEFSEKHWYEFGGQGNGICVEFCPLAIHKFLQESQLAFLGEYVKYGKLKMKLFYDDKLQERKDNLSLMYTLPEELKGEEEYRFVLFSSNKLNNRKMIFPKDCIKSIAIGDRVVDKDEVYKTIKQSLYLSDEKIFIAKYNEQFETYFNRPFLK